ncbi:unnamed protein product [Closterium sp. NIES-54]
MFHDRRVEAIQPARRFSKAPDFSLLTPILYAPLFPLSTSCHPSFFLKLYPNNPNIPHSLHSPHPPSSSPPLMRRPPALASPLTPPSFPPGSVPPASPTVRITLRHKPKLRDRLFVTAVASAFLHGAYMKYVAV